VIKIKDTARVIGLDGKSIPARARNNISNPITPIAIPVFSPALIPWGCGFANDKLLFTLLEDIFDLVFCFEVKRKGALKTQKLQYRTGTSLLF
jgi:hypothetical protein